MRTRNNDSAECRRAVKNVAGSRFIPGSFGIGIDTAAQRLHPPMSTTFPCVCKCRYAILLLQQLAFLALCNYGERLCDGVLCHAGFIVISFIFSRDSANILNDCQPVLPSPQPQSRKITCLRTKARNKEVVH